MQDTNQITDSLLRLYGPLIGGADLRKALGYRSAAAFQRAVRENIINFRVFGVPGRRGKFALTMDVAAWLSIVSNTAGVVALPGTIKAQARNVDEGN